MKTNLLCLKTALFAAGCLFSSGAFAQTQITDEAGLRAIANDLSGHYVLANDIVVSGDWDPIGTDETRFTGTIDGNGKTISGLRYFDSSQGKVGFVGVADRATIKDLRIVDSEIFGAQGVGLVVGVSHASTITGCYASGVASGYDHVGAIVGGSKSGDGDYTLIENCFSSAAIVSTVHQAGGLVGAAVDTDVKNSYFTGIATCPSNCTGGIVALYDGGTNSIENCVSISPYLDGRFVGAILGRGSYDNNVNNHSWDGTKLYIQGVLITDMTDADLGDNGTRQSIETLQSYSFYTDALGWDPAVWKNANAYYPLLNGQSYPLKGDAIYMTIMPERSVPGTVITTNAQSALNRTIAFVSSDTSVATVDADGKITCIGNGTATITGTTQADAYSLGATITRTVYVEGVNYNITSEDDLFNMAFDLEGDYTLMNNIRMTKAWEILGKFKGTFNGNGKVIYGLNFDDASKSEVGLFGETEGAHIYNLGIEEARIVGYNNVAAIVGRPYGSIVEGCYVANSYIEGRDHVSAISGDMRNYTNSEEVEVQSITRNCHSSARIHSREYQVGGIVGTMSGGVTENCYFSGTVSASRGRACGIVSLVDNGNEMYVRNNVNMAASILHPQLSRRIIDNNNQGGIVLSNNYSALNSFLGTSLAQASEGTSGQGDVDSEDGKCVDDDAVLRTRSFYETTLGWDFDNVWKFIPGTEGKLYPVLKWQDGPITSTIYNMPEEAFLEWDVNAMAALTLRKMVGSAGQQLVVKVLEGDGTLVEIDGENLLVAEVVTQAGTAVVGVTPASDVTTYLNMVGADSFDVDVIISGTAFEIRTVDDLINVASKPYANFILMNDIDMTGVEFYGIGSGIAPFSGELDGNGFSIINPVVITGGSGTKGFFNVMDGATVKKLGIANISFAGLSQSVGIDVGGFAGSCKNSVIDQVYVTGTIVALDHAAGFIGGACSFVTLTNCYVDIDLKAGSQIGGFFGVTDGDGITMRNCYYNGKIETTYRGWAGGMIGLIDKPGVIEITNCASMGDVVGHFGAHPFIGGNGTNPTEPKATLMMSGNLANIDATIQLTDDNATWAGSTVEGGSVANHTTYSSTNLKRASTYSGWDFDNIWEIVTQDETYPTLKNVPEKGNVDTGISNMGTTENNEYTLTVENNSVTINGVVSTAKVEIFNVSGQLINAETVNGTSVQISLPFKGFYIARISEEGSVVSVKFVNN